MKTLVAILVLSTNALLATESPLEFPDRRIEVPPLSLLGSTKQDPSSGTIVSPTPIILHSAPRSAMEKRFASKMPVLVPRADIDPKFVKVPDSTVDYKLIIKSTGMAAQK